MPIDAWAAQRRHTQHNQTLHLQIKTARSSPARINSFCVCARVPFVYKPSVTANDDTTAVLVVCCVCVCSVRVPCVALPSGGGSSVGPSLLCGSPVWPPPPVVGPLWGPPLCVGPLCGSPVWVLCVGPLCVGPLCVPLCGSPVWVPCVGPLCGSSVWVPCVGPLPRCVPCGIYSRDVSRSFTRSRSC